MYLRPVHDLVLVLPDAPPSKTHGGLHIPDSVRKEARDSRRGVIVAVGPGKFADGRFVENTVKAGERVVYRSYAGTEVEIDGKVHLAMNEIELLAVEVEE